MLTKALDPIAQRWKDAFLEACEVIPADAALFFSGGVDSASILAALLELDRRPALYGYRLGGEDSPDSRTARMMAEGEQLVYTCLELPRDPEWLVRDTREIIRMTRRSRKTITQCAQPIKLMASRMADDGIRDAILGTGAVVLDDRTVMVKLHDEGEEAAREYRREKLNDRYGDCGTSWMHRMANHYQIRTYEPLSDEPLRSVALALDIAELARGPKGTNIQKGIAMRAFPWFFERPKYWRKNVSLQVGSGLREYHDEVMLASVNNPWGYKRVAAVYAKMLEEVQSEQLKLAD